VNFAKLSHFLFDV